MNKLFPTAITLLISAVLGTPASAAIKCWTNSEGVRECGNTVPPEYAQQGHEELSKQGVLLDQQERAKTEEELAEQARLAEQQAEEQSRRDEQARMDVILLQTFSSVEDIELVRDERLRVIEASIKLAQKRNETIEADLEKRIQAAANAERSGNQPNEELLRDIESLRRQINENNAYIEERQAEADQTRTKYAADIGRFRKLKSL